MDGEQRRRTWSGVRKCRLTAELTYTRTYVRIWRLTAMDGEQRGRAYARMYVNGG